ncbi:MAG: hypothetical protein H6961_00815 [Chromatiaceae bacterium]|nr:hypothetical protein [Chromatiaceae bacterium]
MTDERITDTWLIAEHNEYECLRWIHRAGGLLARQLGRVVWPGSASTKDKGKRMAEITLARLKRDRMIIERPLTKGGPLYVLGERGAALLREHGINHAPARGHRDLSIKSPYHTAICNDYAIDCYLAGEEIWTEFEISRGLAPLPRVAVSSRKTKLPDVFTRASGDCSWIEVENTPKSKVRLREIISVAQALLHKQDEFTVGPNGKDGVMHDLRILLPNDQATRATVNICLAAKDNWSGDSAFATHLIRVEMSPRLMWNGEHVSTPTEK